MTAILNSRGHLILPPEIQRAAQAHPARRFDVMVSTTGVIMLRPERTPRRTLVESCAGWRSSTGVIRSLNLLRREVPAGYQHRL